MALEPFLGSSISGIIIDKFFKIPNAPEGAIQFDWTGIWITFAAYSLVVAVLFAFLFRHKHNPAEVTTVSH